MKQISKTKTVQNVDDFVIETLTFLAAVLKASLWVMLGSIALSRLISSLHKISMVLAHFMIPKLIVMKTWRELNRYLMNWL